MNNFLKLKEEREKLVQEKREAEEQARLIQQQLEDKINSKEIAMAQYYEDFFMKRSHQDFRLYTRFPSTEALQMYMQKKNNKFPLLREGILNAKELAEIIKQIYSYQRQQEYQIYTIGVTEKDTTKEHGFVFEKLVPHLYYLIGNQKTLEAFSEYNGHYMNNERKHDHNGKSFSIWYDLNYAREKDLISLPLKKTLESVLSSKIECFTGSPEDRKEVINYYDYCEKKYRHCMFSKDIQIFKDDLRNFAFTRGFYGYNIKDLFSFYIHRNDSFIARILLSICIYKYNNGIAELTSEDYKHIFETLYGEEVDIIQEAEKDIPRSLKYVPSNVEINLE